DLYRIGDAGELEFLGLDGTDAALWLVEWPKRGGVYLPAPDMLISLALQDPGRNVELMPCSDIGVSWYKAIVQKK
ncbi:MAG: tRNA (adenosine(37)-N6)-threonylcarbamoyltransferase complex ATPase subunit type 1 TsaE, partial [Pseudomonadota bacterium]|nr:tRNA (adenosine(37)-N6)-threonylcarbamoyltransferase complex ATPase subunit type 1 TsaE [Pseudomonadota bacterium]